ncbi:hypothetical protein JL721_296 [Aureococcus anophagefferens]|nr:hypothetical protein JL721_296 [Aureococcus anophagefferens]
MRRLAALAACVLAAAASTPERQELVVVPCCGIGNRIAVMMEALALAHAWSLAPSVNWVRGSVLGAAFGDLWEAHPAFDRVVEVDATSDRGKSGGRVTCGRDGAAARSASGFAEGVAVRDFADLTCAAPAGGPGSGPCKRVWRVPTSDGKLRAVTSRDFFEGRDGRNVSAVRVDDAAFCSARVLSWLDGFRPAAAVPAAVGGYAAGELVGVHLSGADPWDRGDDATWGSKLDVCVGAPAFAEAVLRDAARRRSRGEPATRAVYVASNDAALVAEFADALRAGSDAAGTPRLDVLALDAAAEDRGGAARGGGRRGPLGLASTAAVFRGFHSTFGQAAAVLHRRPQSVIVHRDGCAGAARRNGGASAPRLFCRAHEEGTGDVPVGGLGS